MRYYNGSTWENTDLRETISTLVGNRNYGYNGSAYRGIRLAYLGDGNLSFMYNTGYYPHYPNNSMILNRSGSTVIKNTNAMPFIFIANKASTHYDSSIRRPEGPFAIHPELPQHVAVSYCSGAGSSSSEYGAHLSYTNRTLNNGSDSIWVSGSSNSSDDFYSTGVAWIDKTHVICGSIARWVYSPHTGEYSIHDLSGPMALTSGSGYGGNTKLIEESYSGTSGDRTYPSVHLSIADFGDYNALGIWDNCIGFVNIASYSNLSFDGIFPSSSRYTVNGLSSACVSCVVKNGSGYVVSLYNGQWIYVNPQ